MTKLTYNSKYFNIADTLLCGQVFRFKEYKKGYTVISEDKICYVYTDGDTTYIETDYPEYFHNYFDLNNNYENIVNAAKNFKNEILIKAATLGKGIRILRQNSIEALYHFIISQNNNIPRIKSCIEKLSEKVGQKKSSVFGEYYVFPTPKQILSLSDSDLKEAGLGYRAQYLKELSNSIVNGLDVCEYKDLSVEKLYENLTSIKGVGDKVANCVILFGYHKTESFPVDTWIEKIYREDFNGTIKNRKKITEYFIDLFKENAGYFQQYLFYYKRSLTN